MALARVIPLNNRIPEAKPVQLINTVPDWPEDLKVGIPIGITECLGCKQKMTVATVAFIIRNQATRAIKRIAGYSHPDNRLHGCRDLAERKILRALKEGELLHISQIGGGNTFKSR